MGAKCLIGIFLRIVDILLDIYRVGLSWLRAQSGRRRTDFFLSHLSFLDGTLVPAER
jgi:hypothetical protein